MAIVKILYPVTDVYLDTLPDHPHLSYQYRLPFDYALAGYRTPDSLDSSEMLKEIGRHLQSLNRRDLPVPTSLTEKRGTGTYLVPMEVRDDSPLAYLSPTLTYKYTRELGVIEYPVTDVLITEDKVTDDILIQYKFGLVVLKCSTQWVSLGYGESQREEIWEAIERSLGEYLNLGGVYPEEFDCQNGCILIRVPIPTPPTLEL